MFSVIGVIMLMGLVTKNAILLLDFAIRAREGLDRGDGTHEAPLGRTEALLLAAKVRLRPILMTTVAMIVAMVPLLMAAGPGAASRFDIGLVIASGLGIGTLFTLFVVPAFYLILARQHHPSTQHQ
jgi:multidrug efflux pump